MLPCLSNVQAVSDMVDAQGLAATPFNRQRHVGATSRAKSRSRRRPDRHGQGLAKAMLRGCDRRGLKRSAMTLRDGIEE